MKTTPEQETPARPDGFIRCPNCGNKLGEQYANGQIGVSLGLRGKGNPRRNLIFAGPLVSARCERCGHVGAPALPSPDPVNA